MKLLGFGLLSILLIASANGNPVAYLRQLKWSTVFDLLATPTQNEVRVKRQIHRALGSFAIACEAGWTGPFCENPICSQPVVLPPDNNEATRMLDDPIFDQTTCAGTNYFPVDSMTARITISASSSSAVPTIIVTDTNGNTVSPIQSSSAGPSRLNVYQGMAPGPYALTLDLGGAPTTFCYASIEAVSMLSIRMGWVENYQSDDPPHNEAAQENMNNIFVMRIYNLPEQGTVNTVSMRRIGQNFTAWRAVLNRRYNCAYAYFAAFMACTKDFRYYMSVDGVDGRGFQFRRSAIAPCLAQITTPAPPTTTLPPLLACTNGGILLNPNTPDASCYCPPLFTGRNCDSALCMNGGTQTGGLTCQCAAGFSGPNCQDVSCTDALSPPLADFRSLVVVVRGTASMAPSITQIVTAINRVKSTFDADGIPAFRSYVLITVANNVVTDQYFFINQYDEFITALNALNTSTTVGNTSDSIFTAIELAFNQIIFNKSPMYVFTDVPANDGDLYRNLLGLNANRKFSIYFTVPNTVTTNATDILDPGFRIMDTVARYTGGLVARLGDNNGGNFLFAVEILVRNTLYHANPVLSNDLQRCDRQPAFQTFFVDSSAQNVRILATGVEMSVIITDPNNVAAPLVDIGVGNFHLFQLAQERLMVGEYVFTMTSSSANLPCSYRVIARSDYEVFYASSPALTTDAGFSEPVYQNPRHMVASFTGLARVPDPFRLYAEMTINVNDENDNQIPIYYSNGIWRDGCGYRLYFGNFNCQTPDQLLYMTMYADDSRGFTIQRTSTAFCAAINPTTSPPGTCLNGGVANPTNATRCLCPNTWTGDFCEQIICFNGGTGTTGRCECPPGLTGRFCETNTCLQTATGIDFSAERKSLGLVLSIRPGMQDALSGLASSANEFARDVQSGSPYWLIRYTIIVINETNAIMVSDGSDPQKFVDTLQDINRTLSAVADPNYQGDCTVLIESGLQMALSMSRMYSYIFVFTDANGKAENMFGELIGEAERLRTSINFVQVNNEVCNGTGLSNQLDGQFYEMAIFSGGDVYITDDTARFLIYITTFHSSGLAYERFSPDCVGMPITAYIPIDGWTQSFTVAVTGLNPNVTVYLPDGTPARMTFLENEMLRYRNNSLIDLMQYIIPCDSFWSTYNDSQCYRFQFNEMNWTASRDGCHVVSGGFLADIHSDRKQAFLDGQTQGIRYWIGLNRTSDTNVWTWDTPDGVPSAPIGVYTNWAVGEPAFDNALRCVMVRPDPASNNTPKWFASDCAATAYSPCQRQRYGQGVVTNDPTTNLLPAGIWKATVSSGGGGCTIQARAQSFIQSYFGFVQDIHSDQAQTYANIESESNRVIATVNGLFPINPNAPNGVSGSVNYAFMFKARSSTNVTAAAAVTFEERRQCAYQMVSQTFKCPDFGSGQRFGGFGIKFSGIDQFGNLFERIHGAMCQTIVSNCLHGGTNFQGVCYCTPGWAGMNCEVRLCQNGGISTSQGTCQCFGEFTGEFCESALCEPPYPMSFTDDNRTLAILLETSYGMASTIWAVRRQLSDILAAVLTGPTQGWFGNFIFIPFDSQSNREDWYPSVYSRNYTDLVNALNAIPLGVCPGNRSCETGNQCPRPILFVLDNMALLHSTFLTPNSVVLIVTRSAISDYTNLGLVSQNLQTKHAQVHVILPSIASPCGLDWSLPEANTFFALTRLTGGSLFMMSSFDLAGNFLQQYLPSIYRSSIVETGFGRSYCNASFAAYFQLDTQSYEFTVDFYGSNYNLTLTSPDGMIIPMPDPIFVSDVNYLGVIVVNASGFVKPGTYKLTMSSTEPICGLTIRARSIIETFVGYTQVTDSVSGATQDDAHFAPIVGPNNIPLVHIRNPRGSTLTYIQFVDQDGFLLYSSDLRVRDSACTFQYYGTKTFNCRPGDTFVTYVYGIDGNGYNFRRSQMSHCVFGRDRPPPPPAFCTLTDRVYDILFLLDSSMSQTGPGFDQLMKQYVRMVTDDYAISSTRTQVAVLTVSNAARTAFTLAQSNATNLVDLINAIPYQGGLGQDTTSALLSAVIDHSTTAAGYRPSARHLIVYVTGTTMWSGNDTEPEQFARAMRRSGTWGIAGVGVRLDNLFNLESLTDGERCVYSAMSDEDLFTNAVNFIQSMTCFRVPFCSDG